MKPTTDRAVIETRKVLLATFIVGRDLETVPPLEPVVDLERVDLKDCWPIPSKEVANAWAAAQARDLAAWTSALGGKTPQEVSQEFVQEGLLERRAPVQVVMLPGFEPEQRIGHLTAAGFAVLRGFLNEVEFSEWHVDSHLGKSRVKSVLKWVLDKAGSAVASAATIGTLNAVGILDRSADAFHVVMMKLRQLVGDASHPGERSTKEGTEQRIIHPWQLPVPTQLQEMPVAPPPEPEPGLSHAEAVEPVTATVFTFWLLAARVVRWFRQHRCV